MIDEEKVSRGLQILPDESETLYAIDLLFLDNSAKEYLEDFGNALAAMRYFAHASRDMNFMLWEGNP